MKRIYLLTLLTILTLIYLTGCNSKESNSSPENELSKNELSEEMKVNNNPPEEKELIVDDVNLGYIKWFHNHSNALFQLSTKGIGRSIDNYNSRDFSTTIKEIEWLIDQANSMNFSDPTGQLTAIHSSYLDSLNVLEEATILAEGVFLESGAIDGGQYKLLSNSILRWQSEVQPAARSIQPFLEIYIYTGIIAESPTPDNFAKRAEYYEAVSLYEQALKDYQKAYDLLPESDYLKRKIDELSSY